MIADNALLAIRIAAYQAERRAVSIRGLAGLCRIENLLLVSIYGEGWAVTHLTAPPRHASTTSASTTTHPQAQELANCTPNAHSTRALRDSHTSFGKNHAFTHITSVREDYIPVQLS
jgi:hypothetical protein